MKRIKWDSVQITPEVTLAAFLPEHCLPRSRARMSLTASSFQKVYNDWTGDVPAFELAHRVLDFGGWMLKFGAQPSLIAMNVPFHVRRQVYEAYVELGDIIHHSLNSEDRYFNEWSAKQTSRGRDVVNKASLARALWAWYYTVFEPVAKRFVTNGSEHMLNNFK